MLFFSKSNTVEKIFISTSKQYNFTNVKSTSKINAEKNVDFGLTLKAFLLLCYNVREIAIFMLRMKR